MRYNNLSLLLEDYIQEVSGKTLKRIDLVILDATDLYVYRPSLYTINGMSLLSILEIDSKGIENFLDSFLIKEFIHYVLVEDMDMSKIIPYIDNLLYKVFEKFKILSGFNLYDNPHAEHIYNYFKELYISLKRILDPYTAGYVMFKNEHDTDDIFRYDKVFIVHTIDTTFKLDVVTLHLAVKLYSKR